VRSQKKGDGTVDVGVQDLYHTAELLFKIHVLFVIMIIELLSSTSHFVFVFIFKISEKNFIHNEDQHLVT